MGLSSTTSITSDCWPSFGNWQSTVLAFWKAAGIVKGSPGIHCLSLYWILRQKICFALKYITKTFLLEKNSQRVTQCLNKSNVSGLECSSKYEMTVFAHTDFYLSLLLWRNRQRSLSWCTALCHCITKDKQSFQLEGDRRVKQWVILQHHWSDIQMPLFHSISAPMRGQALVKGQMRVLAGLRNHSGCQGNTGSCPFSRCTSQ